MLIRTCVQVVRLICYDILNIPKLSLVLQFYRWLIKDSFVTVYNTYMYYLIKYSISTLIIKHVLRCYIWYTRVELSRYLTGSGQKQVPKLVYVTSVKHHDSQMCFLRIHSFNTIAEAHEYVKLLDLTQIN
mgnify:CR=1 FL=1